jgi:ribonuclease HI
MTSMCRHRRINTTEELRCIQWNARGLSKSKLEEFRNFISSTNPEIVLLSETHWTDAFNVKFKAYHIAKKNRPNRMGGGVAILIHKSLQFLPLNLKETHSVEAIGVQVICSNNTPCNFISAYVPKGDCDTDEIVNLISAGNNFVTGGDFNGHHGAWESNARANKAGRSIMDALLQQQNACLITPPDLGTRVDPATGKESTIDLVFTSPSLASNSTITKGPHLGSDHIPILIYLNAQPVRSSGRPTTWILNDKKWASWNSSLDSYLAEENFLQIVDPEVAAESFTRGLERANQKHFKKPNPERSRQEEPRRPWWDDRCADAVKNARKLFRAWRNSPLSMAARIEWSRAEARKKKVIMAAKRQAWAHLVQELGAKDPTKMWSFVKAMQGKGSVATPDGRTITLEGQTFTEASDKARVFLDQFSTAHPSNLQSNRHYEEVITSSSTSISPCILNDPITMEEIENCLPTSKSNAVGTDLIHNGMLRNLTGPNKIALKHLMNTLLTSAFVPPQWKESIIVPLLKPGKQEDDPNSYRPVALTSCLCKAMERILVNRLHWFLETKLKVHKDQAGFRKGCSTMDHIIRLETDIKQGFSEGHSTVAVYLDISKAYDTVWTQGLLYKMARLGISGSILGWTKNFLTGRSMRVRIGNHLSPAKRVENGVPQGAVISPILFNIMMSDFPNHWTRTRTLLFADDILIYTRTKLPIGAETTLQPAIDDVGRWGRKWKFKFAPDKSGAITFTRAYKPGDDPLLFLYGHRIQPKTKAKFLGVLFDYKLLWGPHIDQVIKSCMSVKNLFKVLAKTKTGPTVQILIRLFKSLAQSRIDYGLIAYGHTSKNNLDSIDRMHRSILRIILGAKISTPKEILYADTDTVPTSLRRSWLARKYLIQLSTKPQNPMYETAKLLYSTNKVYPKRSSPALLLEMRYIDQLGIATFEETPAHFSTYSYPPPSRPPPCRTLWFPLSKKSAVADHRAVAELFSSLNNQIPEGTLRIFTDGAKQQKTNRTTCALHIPSLEVSRAWTLTEHASIFTAELQAIYQALDYAFKMDEHVPAVAIYCDSKSAVSSIASSAPGNNESLHGIRETMASLKSSGTLTTILWIPSHVGIRGNEEADRLATRECSSPTGTRIKINLSPSEKISIVRTDWKEKVLLNLKNCLKPCIQSRISTGLVRWLYHKDRGITVCLQRLRSGHNYLNAFSNRIDQGADPSCRKGCEEIENVNHVLVDCQANEPHRHKLRYLLSNNNLEFNVNNLLGLNLNLSPTLQFKIRDTLAKFLSVTAIIDMA